jgi:amino acid transporter
MLEWASGFAIALTVMIVVAGAIAELASKYPGAIGVRTILSATLGSRVGFFASYLYLLVVPAVASVESHFLIRLIEAALSGVSGKAVVATLFFILLCVNCLGYALSLWSQFVMTFALVVGSIGISGFPHAAPNPAAVVLESGYCLMPVAGSAIIVIFLFMGFEWVTASGKRKEEYHRQIPNAMFIGLGILAVVYFAFAWSLHVAVPQAKESALLELCLARYGSIGRVFALTLGSFAAGSTLNAGLLGGARMVYVLSRENALPRALSWVWWRTGTPVAALVSLWAVCAMAAYVGTATGAAVQMAVLAAIIECVVYALLLVAAFRSRSGAPATLEGYRSRLPSPIFLGVALVLLGICSLVLQDQAKVIVGVSMAAAVALFFATLNGARAAQREPAPE